MTMQYVDPDFQRELEQFNDSRGGPARVAVCWNPRKNRWQIWVIPVQDSLHPLAKNSHTVKLMQNFPDESGRRGILLNTWQGANGEYLPLDSRLFEALHWADSFRSRHHFEETIRNPEMQAEIALSKKARDLAYAGRSYWQKLDSMMISMNPNVRTPGDWRSTKGWR